MLILGAGRHWRTAGVLVETALSAGLPGQRGAALNIVHMVATRPVLLQAGATLPAGPGWH